MTSDCRQALPARARSWMFCLLVLCTIVLAPALASAQPPAHGATPAAGERAAEGHAADAPHAEGILPVIARLVNFGLLAGLLIYFLKTPLMTYLASRGSEISQDLVTAAEMRRTAAEQLAEIDRRMQALPAELEALKVRGAEDVRAEQARISETLAAERARSLEHMRREIEMRLRVARRELVEHAAELAMAVAGQRIKNAMTSEDHLRLVDRYTSQLEEVR